VTEEVRGKLRGRGVKEGDEQGKGSGGGAEGSMDLILHPDAIYLERGPCELYSVARCPGLQKLEPESLLEDVILRREDIKDGMR
jgi:hypothetical protein